MNIARYDHKGAIRPTTPTPRMTRAEFRAEVKPRVPSAEFSTSDGTGTKLNQPYIDVTIHPRDLETLNGVCAALGKQAVFVSVLPYPRFDYTPLHRRVDLSKNITPPAACPRCGGWTGCGGMSQYSKSEVPVFGRIGCTCHR